MRRGRAGSDGGGRGRPRPPPSNFDAPTTRSATSGTRLPRIRRGRAGSTPSAVLRVDKGGPAPGHGDSVDREDHVPLVQPCAAWWGCRLLQLESGGGEGRRGREGEKGYGPVGARQMVREKVAGGGQGASGRDMRERRRGGGFGSWGVRGGRAGDGEEAYMHP